MLDVDGDGLSDALAVNGLAFRNISTPTEIVFDTQSTIGLGASNMDYGDFNADGKLDVTVTDDVSGDTESNFQVCDSFGACAQRELTIQVAGDLKVYNAVSPNGDNKNDVFYIEFIDLLPDARKNKVTIYNRWGDLVFETEDYNNTDRVFTGLNKNGNELPSGTYYYKIVFEDRKAISGYFSLRR